MKATTIFSLLLAAGSAIAAPSKRTEQAITISGLSATQTDQQGYITFTLRDPNYDASTGANVSWDRPGSPVAGARTSDGAYYVNFPGGVNDIAVFTLELQRVKGAERVSVTFNDNGNGAAPGTKWSCTSINGTVEGVVEMYRTISRSPVDSFFDSFTCARLQVPLDYGDLSQGTTAIAFIKLAAANVTANTQNLLINHGGPGGLASSSFLREDPFWLRDWDGSITLSASIPEESGKVVLSWTAGRIILRNGPTLNTQYYAAELFGKACTENVGGPNGNASFVSTPAVAHDLFTYINAEQKLAGKPLNESKISYFAVSYGTVLGATFASLYPDHVGRMVLDGVVDAEDYYNLGWRANLYDADKALNSFSKCCFQSRATNCSFWGPSVQNITSRLDGLLANLKYHPVPIPSSDACDIPLMATYSDLKEFILSAMYTPLSNFPALADVLSGLERGNTSAYVSAVTDGFLPANPCNNGSGRNGTTDVDTLIKCVDGYAGQKFENLTDYRNYVDTLTTQSRFFGEVWPNNANGVLCRSFDAKPPQSGRLPGSILETRKTSFPILFVTAETDPVTPERNAYKMSSVFPGSVVLTQASVGHTAIASVSSCYLKNVRLYLNGQLPAANTTCQPDVLPFQGSAALSFGR